MAKLNEINQLLEVYVGPLEVRRQLQELIKGSVAEAERRAAFTKEQLERIMEVFDVPDHHTQYVIDSEIYDVCKKALSQVSSENNLDEKKHE